MHSNSLLFFRKWNRSVSDEILYSVNNSIESFLYGNDVQGRIISGMEEATSAWVTVNYISGKFDQKYVSSTSEQCH